MALPAQHKWDLDSVYQAEFGVDTPVVKVSLPAVAFHVNAVGVPFGVLEGQVEVRLMENKSVLFGGSHTSYFYRYGQPNDPERLLPLNHYGSYVYEEWVFENAFTIDFRQYWWGSSRSKERLHFIALSNRFVNAHWDFSQDIS